MNSRADSVYALAALALPAIQRLREATWRPKCQAAPPAPSEPVTFVKSRCPICRRPIRLSLGTPRRTTAAALC